MKQLLYYHARYSSRTSFSSSWCTTIGLRRCLSSISPNGDPHALRILFCGSDEFSIQSLEALHKYAHSEGSKVQSIDVATRTDKRTGRGLKNITAPPIKHAAQRLGLALHQFDTFRGWQLPTIDDSETTYINMIVAVSFGLLVPPRILNACHFGGLNVHPSMLPDLKGSAPIEHAIAHGYKSTGVTIQTLHPSKFDEGQIVLQTPQPGMDIPDPDNITSDELKCILAPIGAEMLVQTLQEGLYLREAPKPVPPQDVNHASKILPETRHIDFTKSSVTDILRMNRAFSRLWIRVQRAQEKQREIRVIFGPALRLAQAQDIENIPVEVLRELKIGLPFAIARNNVNIKHSSNPLFVKAADSDVLLVSEILVSGMKAGLAAAKAAKADLFEEPHIYGDYLLHTFKKLPD